MTIEIGTRVRLTESVYNYPTILVEAGETGTLDHIVDGNLYIRMDKHYPELNEWDNCLEIVHYDDVPAFSYIAKM